MMYQSDADRQAALEANYSRLSTTERQAIEDAQWRQQFESERAMSDRQFNEMKRQFEAQQANTRNQMAQQASLYNQTRLDTKAAQDKADREAAIEAEAAKIAATPVPESTGGGITIYDKLNAFKTAPLQTKIGSLLPLSAEYAWKRGGDLISNIGNWFSGR
jgi:hypothetical protein